MTVGRLVVVRVLAALLAAAVCLFSTSAVAADVVTYQTGVGDGFSSTVSGSPQASCAAAYGLVREIYVRTFSQPESQGVCWATHFVGFVGGVCTYAAFASLGIPPESCPPTSGGYPDNPHYHVHVGMITRVVDSTHKGLGWPKTHCTEGNPCDPATGNKIQAEVDYAGTGPFPLRFVRTYNWLSNGAGGNLGPKWRHNYDRRLFVNAAADAVAAFRDDGAAMKFELAGASWVPDADVTDRLEAIPGGQWMLTAADGDVTEKYDAAGKLLEIANRAGVKQTLSYFSSGPNAGMLQQVTDHFGRTIRFAYTAQNLLLSMTDPDGKMIRYDYDTSVRLVTVTYPGASAPDATRRYLYQNSSFPFALTGIQDENGDLFATFAYSNGLVVESKHAGDAGRIQLAYPSSSQTTVTSHVSSSLSATRIYGFETILGVKHRTSIGGPACPACGPKTETFDSATGFRRSSTDWNDKRTCFQHDAQGRELVRAEGLTGTCPSDLASWTPVAGTVERKITTQWHATWRLPTRICEPKRVTTLSYEGCGASGALCSRTFVATGDAQGGSGCSATPAGTARTWRYSYDANGQVLTLDGPRTDVVDLTTYSYYPDDDPELGKRGNVATITNAAGHVTQVSGYDGHGKPLTIVDANGLVTALTYDARQRLASRSVGGELTSYEYDGVGQTTRVTLHDGSFVAYAYDAAHRLTAITDNLGNRIAYTLDAAGNRIREDVFDPGNALAQTKARVYSALNRLDQEIGGTSPATQITRFAYDDQGNVTSITDPLSRATANAYDALNRLRQVTDPAAGIAGYDYDGRDQLVSVTDPRNNATTYAVDGLGNLSVQSSPDTGNTANTHDAAGNVVASRDAKEQTTSYAYDALNRVVRIVHEQATGTQLKQVDYLYDQGANAVGRLTTITETSAAGATLLSTTYGYDQHGRTTAESRAIGGVTYTTRYEYDAAGRMAAMTYPSGRTVAYGLDGLGRVNRIETTGGGTTQVVVQDVTYQPFGPAKSFTFGNLQADARSFDLDGRIAAHTLGNQTKALSFDAASRIARIEQQGVPTNFADYGYDRLDRLTNTVLATSTFSYGYDAAGNRLLKSTGASSDQYAYAATSNRLAGITGGTQRTYTHDANGSIASDGVKGFGYDARARLVSSTSAAGSTIYQVNALGQRVRKTSSFADMVFHYDREGRLIAETSPAGRPIREYLWLGDRPVAVAGYQSTGGQCPATPVRDRSQTFAPFDARERLEAKGGEPGPRGWEWALGPAVGTPGGFVQRDVEWRSGRTYAYRLTYRSDGTATLDVSDGATPVVVGLLWSGGAPMRLGNAVRLVLRVHEFGPDARAVLTIDTIDGYPVNERIVVRGDEAGDPDVGRRIYAGRSLEDGFTIEGSLRLIFPTGEVPTGRQFDLRVMAGTVQCQSVAQTFAGLYYIHADHLNTPRVVTDSQQRVVWRWENQEPFGNNPPEENPSGLGSFEFALRFPGQYADKETGLFYNYFRDYDPQTGRYVQSDPIGLAGGINPYVYVGGNPLSFAILQGLKLINALVPLEDRPGEMMYGRALQHWYNCVSMGAGYVCGEPDRKWFGSRQPRGRNNAGYRLLPLTSVHEIAGRQHVL